MRAGPPLASVAASCQLEQAGFWLGLSELELIRACPNAAGLQSLIDNIFPRFPFAEQRYCLLRVLDIRLHLLPQLRPCASSPPSLTCTRIYHCGNAL